MPEPPAVPTGIEIRPVTVDDGLRIYSDYIAERWSIPTSASGYLRSTLETIRIGAPGTPNSAWVAVKEGRAIAKATFHESDGVVGIYGTTTRPEYRGQGLARLVCLKTLIEARNRGHTTSVLQATPMAVGLYRSMGFRGIVSFGVFTVPNSFHT